MRKLFSKMDIPLFIMVVLYVALGLVMIYSASNITAVVRYGYQPYHFFIRQAIFVLVSFFIGFLIVLRFPTRNYGALAWPLVFLLIGSSYSHIILLGFLPNTLKLKLVLVSI